MGAAGSHHEPHGWPPVGGSTASGGSSSMDVAPQQPIEIGVQISSHMGFMLTTKGGYFRTTALTSAATNYPGISPGFGGGSSPYDYIDVITFATAAPGFYSTAYEAILLKPIFTELSKYKDAAFHQSKFPPFDLTGAALITPKDVLRIVKGRTIYNAPRLHSLSHTALTISSYIPNKDPPDQALTGYLYFIDPSEDPKLVEIGGIHDLHSGEKHDYYTILNINTNTPFMVDDTAKTRIKDTRIATFEEMLPFLVNFFTAKYNRTVRLKLYFTGCGKIGQLFTTEADGGGYTYTALKDMDDAAIGSLSGAVWGATPNVINYDTLDELNVILRGHLFGGGVAAGGGGKAGGARTRCRRKYKRSTKRTRKSTRKSPKKLANSRHMVRNRRRASLRRAQI